MNANVTESAVLAAERQFVIRRAETGESGALTSLALRSKAYWGYDDQFMAACRDELTVEPETLTDPACHCAVADGGGVLLGYYTAVPVADDAYELDALFVEPAYIGLGIGRALLRHALETVRPSGVSKLVIQGDPNAREFYIANGARQIGQRESASVAGRMLPLFEIDLA